MECALGPYSADPGPRITSMRSMSAPESVGQRAGTRQRVGGHDNAHIDLGDQAQQADHVGAVGVFDLLAGDHRDGRGRFGDVLLVLGGAVDDVLFGQELELQVDVLFLGGCSVACQNKQQASHDVGRAFQRIGIFTQKAGGIN